MTKSPRRLHARAFFGNALPNIYFFTLPKAPFAEGNRFIFTLASYVRRALGVALIGKNI